MRIRTLIVDDEPLARERVQVLLREEPDVEVLGECPGGDTALAAIGHHHPDLLLLDVQITGMDGFTLLQAIAQRRRPAVIFTTGHDQHALRAFDLKALDYLLKPFSHARFKEAIQRAREHFGALQRSSATPPPLPGSESYLTRLTAKDGDKVVVLKASDIDTIESAGNYVMVLSGQGSLLLRQTLNALCAQLDPKRFMRVSRSAIVNLQRVKEFLPRFKGQHVIVLHNGKQLPMTRSLSEVEQAVRFS